METSLLSKTLKSLLRIKLIDKAKNYKKLKEIERNLENATWCDDVLQLDLNSCHSWLFISLL